MNRRSMPLEEGARLSCTFIAELGLQYLNISFVLLWIQRVCVQKIERDDQMSRGRSSSPRRGGDIFVVI